MIKVNGKEIKIEHFPDGTQRLKLNCELYEKEYMKLFKRSFIKPREKRLIELSALGLLNYTNDRVMLTEKGHKLIMNKV